MKKTILCLFAVCALTFGLSAKPLAVALDIVINQPSTVAGVLLAPGNYQVVVANGTASFERDGKELCRVQVHGTRSTAISANNELVFDSSLTLKRIHLEGSNEILVLD